MHTEAALDKQGRLYLSRADREAAGLEPGQKLSLTIAPGYITITAPEVTARLLKRGKLKVIDGPKQKQSASEAVEKARHYQR